MLAASYVIAGLLLLGAVALALGILLGVAFGAKMLGDKL